MVVLDDKRLLHVVHRVRSVLSDFWSGRPFSPLPDPVIGDSGAVASMPAPSCPRCGAAMVRRMARKGSKAGSIYWGCELFPACRGARPGIGPIV